jgi:hypothetical protein
MDKRDPMPTPRWFGILVGQLIIVLLVGVSIPKSHDTARAYLVKTQNNARQLVVLMKIFAENHRGFLPKNLSPPH